ncbi:MAG: response regulator transcription factor [Bacteroidia bacterium]|nr:response regulator transcription factor [Bacteroidia bacterium]
MIKIIIADDHPIVRDGLRSALDSIENFHVIGVAVNGVEALNLIKSDPPDLLLTDISMPEMNGIDLTREVTKKYPDVKVIILSMHENDAYINNALQAGAHGYLLKDSEKAELNNAIERVVAGEKYFSKSVSQILVNGLYNKPGENGEDQQDVTGISKRELEVLEMIALGLSNKEIAGKLFLSIRTVDAHRYNIMQKLKVKNTAEMIKTAVKMKLIEF